MPRWVHTIGKKHRVAAALQVNPHARASEAGVADASRTHQITAAPAREGDLPAEATSLVIRWIRQDVFPAQVLQYWLWLKTASDERLNVPADSAQRPEHSCVSGHTTQCERVFVVDLAAQEPAAPWTVLGRSNWRIGRGCERKLLAEPDSSEQPARKHVQRLGVDALQE